MKKLEFNLGNNLSTECWNYYRIAIIESDTTTKDWSFQKLDHIYADNNYNIFFGEHGIRYNLFRYYNEVLESIGYFASEISGNFLIDFIKKSIDDNKYVLIECNYNYLNLSRYPKNQDILIYGYNDKTESFYAPILFDYNWKEISLNYTYIKDYYIKYHFNNIQSDIRTERIDFLFSYPIVTLQLKKNSIRNPNICSFATELKKIYTYSFRDYKYIFRTLNEENEEFYGYLSCIQLLIKACDFFNEDYNFILNLRKLYEYKIRYDKSIQYYIDYFSLAIEINVSLIHLLETSLLLSIKYFITKDAKYINKTKNILKKIYQEEILKIEELLRTTKKYIITH